MAYSGPEQRGFKEEYELTLAEKEAISSAEAMKANLIATTEWMNSQALPIFEEMERSTLYFEKTGNINYFPTVQKKREGLANKLSEFKLAEELQNIIITNHLKIFALERRTNIINLIKKLNFRPDRLHPVDIEDYIARAKYLIGLLDNFILFTRSKRRGDNTISRQIQLDADLNLATKPDEPQEDEKIGNSNDPEFSP